MEREENEKGVEGNEKGEIEEGVEQPGLEEEEICQCEDNPLQNSLQEDEFPKILANTGKYAQPLSPLELHIEEEPKEHSAQDKGAPEELPDKEVEEENYPIHDEGMIGEKSDTKEEQSIPNQTTLEEF